MSFSYYTDQLQKHNALLQIKEDFCHRGASRSLCYVRTAEHADALLTPLTSPQQATINHISQEQSESNGPLSGCCTVRKSIMIRIIKTGSSSLGLGEEGKRDEHAQRTSCTVFASAEAEFLYTGAN